MQDRAPTVPIGRAIANAEVYVLRADGEPWPNLRATGILLAGAWGESSAMREIGAQAAGLAERLSHTTP